MFRKMRRFKQELAKEECIRILKEEKRGVIAVCGDGGYPYAVPINFYYDEQAETVYFHSAKEGHKIDAIRNCSKVCFTVWDKGVPKEGDWSYYVKSVIAFGRAEELEDGEEKYEKLRLFGLKYYPTAEGVDEEIRKDGARVNLVAIRIEHMTGKQVHEK